GGVGWGIFFFPGWGLAEQGESTVAKEWETGLWRDQGWGVCGHLRVGCFIIFLNNFYNLSPLQQSLLFINGGFFFYLLKHFCVRLKRTFKNGKKTSSL
ncbi:hypothetical protein, partial [Staphylococcus aureus]|uniref:hypothetical protein n=1 Tax=Staphylococcus aureus TaxID=1280 RepID=UPI00210BF57A